MEFSCWKTAIDIYFLVTLLRFLGSANGNLCLPHVSGPCGESVSLPCDFDPNFEGVYWFDESDGEKPLIRLESGYKDGRGYKSHEYDVLENGSLVIKNTQFTNNQQYTVILLDSEFRVETFTVDFSVTENCPSRATGRLNTEGVISCCFNPENEGVYWFEEHDDIEPLIRSESGSKFGRGYDSNEHDMLLNGSLVIKKVRHTHEQTYKVILLDTEFREKTIFVDFSVTVEPSCPSPQKGLLGEPSIIICHFNTDFKRVSWIVEDSENDPLIQREGSTISGPGFTDNKYDVSNNGSLIIRRVSEENNATYKVILVDVNNKSFTYQIDFEAETFCTNLPPPNNGKVKQTAKLAEYNCDEGFHLHNNNALVECILNEATDTYHWSGPIPKCVKGIVTTTTVSTTTVATTPKTTTTKIYSSTTGSTTTNTPRPTLNDKNVHRNTIGSNTDKVHPTNKKGGSNSSHLRVHLAVITLSAITPFLCLITW